MSIKNPASRGFADSYCVMCSECATRFFETKSRAERAREGCSGLGHDADVEPIA